MDRDTVRGRDAHASILRRFDKGEIDVLVGTQMIAKGHDFPNVTLVGVLAADHALGLPDFRAGERAFQLLTQVAGRAGRGERPGIVIAQAFDPSHPILIQAARQDYAAFYAREIAYRRALRYPPLSALVQIIVAHRDEGTAWRIANDVAAALAASPSAPRLTIAGPGPAPIERLRGLFRMQILIRSAGRRRLVETVSQALAPIEGTAARKAVHIDVDPVNLL
jgi:primosomal protein N' (replication factor Y)